MKSGVRESFSCISFHSSSSSLYFSRASSSSCRLNSSSFRVLFLLKRKRTKCNDTATKAAITDFSKAPDMPRIFRGMDIELDYWLGDIEAAHIYSKCALLCDFLSKFRPKRILNRNLMGPRTLFASKILPTMYLAALKALSVLMKGNNLTI